MSEFDDVAFLKTPGKWPCYPLCPVKTREAGNSGWPQVGFVIAAKPTVVWLANMIAACERELDMEAVEIREYESIEDLACEWLVD